MSPAVCVAPVDRGREPRRAGEHLGERADSPAAAAASSRSATAAGSRASRTRRGRSGALAGAWARRPSSTRSRTPRGGRARGCRARAAAPARRARPRRPQQPLRRISCSRWPRTCVLSVSSVPPALSDSRSCERNAGKFSFCSNEDMGSGAQLWGVRPAFWAAGSRTQRASKVRAGDRPIESSRVFRACGAQREQVSSVSVEGGASPAQRGLGPL